MSTIAMADSTTVALLPSGMPAYAGYVDGLYPTYAGMVARFPSALHLSITTRHFYDPNADCLDVETGDAFDSDAPGFVTARPGLRVLYRQQASVRSLMAALGSMPRSRYKLLTAHYSSFYGEHICGPTTCGIPWQADGTQWVDVGPYDLSVLSAGFFQASPILQEVEGDMFIKESDNTVYQLIYNGSNSYWRSIPSGMVGDLPASWIVSDPNGSWLALWKVGASGKST